MARREPQCAVLRDSSPDRVRSADLLSTLLVPRLLLSPLIAHNALIRTMAAPRFTLCCRAWVRLRHALLAAMLAALILHTFPDRFLSASRSDLVFTAFARRTTLNFFALFSCQTMRSGAVGFHLVCGSAPRARTRPEPKSAWQVLTPASLSKAGESHSIQACYLGPRGRLTVLSDGDRVGTDAAGSGRVERRQRRTGRHRYQNDVSQDEVEQDEVRHDHRNECRLQEGRGA
jgi:hypothetical protein